MFCPKCGSEIGNTGICSKCGKSDSVPGATKSGNKSKVFVLVGVVFTVIAAAVIGYFNSKPFLYQAAQSSMNEGKYEEAEKTFSRIIDYRDSQELLSETWYRHVKECMEKQEYDLASELLEKLEEYEASCVESGINRLVLDPSFYILCREEIADFFRQQERYEEAMKLYSELGMVWECAETYAVSGDYAQALSVLEGYECSKEQKDLVESWRRLQIIQYVEEGAYEKAAEELKIYKGAFDSELCPYVYRIARNSADSGKHLEALQFIDKMRNAKYSTDEVEDLLAECSEAMGIACVGEKKYSEAWEYFRVCNGRVTDAGRPALYEVGRFLTEQAYYAEAYGVWEMLKDYQDSTEQLKECCKLWGTEYLQAGDYASAVSRFQECGNGELIKEATYLWAENAVWEENYDLALEKLQELGNYENGDAAAYRYKLAEYIAYQERSLGSLEFAYSLYTGLGDYEDSAERALKTAEKVSERRAEEEKKERIKNLEGNWKTGSGTDRFELFVSLYNKGTIETVVIEMYYNKHATIADGQIHMNCGVWNTDFSGGSVSNYANIKLENDNVYKIRYNDNEVDYWDGNLYLGGWSYPCTVSGNTMTLTVGGKTLTLTK